MLQFALCWRVLDGMYMYWYSWKYDSIVVGMSKCWWAVHTSRHTKTDDFHLVNGCQLLMMLNYHCTTKSVLTRINFNWKTCLNFTKYNTKKNVFTITCTSLYSYMLFLCHFQRHFTGLAITTTRSLVSCLRVTWHLLTSYHTWDLHIALE